MTEEVKEFYIVNKNGNKCLCLKTEIKQIQFRQDAELSNTFSEEEIAYIKKLALIRLNLAISRKFKIVTHG